MIWKKKRLSCINLNVLRIYNYSNVNYIEIFVIMINKNSYIIVLHIDV